MIGERHVTLVILFLISRFLKLMGLLDDLKSEPSGVEGTMYVYHTFVLTRTHESFSLSSVGKTSVTIFLLDVPVF